MAKGTTQRKQQQGSAIPKGVADYLLKHPEATAFVAGGKWFFNELTAKKNFGPGNYKVFKGPKAN